MLGASSSAGGDIQLSDESYVSFPQALEASTTSDLDLQRRQRVQLKVFDLLGGSVNVLLDQDPDGGRHEIEWQPPSSVT